MTRLNVMEAMKSLKMKNCEGIDGIPQCRDNGNDFSFPVPSPFLKLNDNDVNSFLNGYPIF